MRRLTHFDVPIISSLSMPSKPTWRHFAEKNLIVFGVVPSSGDTEYLIPPGRPCIAASAREEKFGPLPTPFLIPAAIIYGEISVNNAGEKVLLPGSSSDFAARSPGPTPRIGRSRGRQLFGPMHLTRWLFRPPRLSAPRFRIYLRDRRPQNERSPRF